MQRTVLLVKPEQYRKLSSLAKREKVSVAEINRRAIEYYINSPQEDLDALTLMVDALIKSNHEAKKALDQAEAALAKTIKSLKHQHK